MTETARSLAEIALAAIGGRPAQAQSVDFVAAGSLPSAFPVTDFAAATIATAGLAIAELLAQLDGHAPRVTVDRRLASFWFYASIRPIGWALPPVWDLIAGDYQAQDGWIRLHTNAPHHRAAAERVLGAHSDKDSMARTLTQWKKQDLESAIVAAGGCAAEMRSTAEWLAHPQGRAVAEEPLAHVETHQASAPCGWAPSRQRPLQGLRVLDLTRVLAGPIASRFLAGFGAEVLRIDPPGWDEANIAPEVTLGKRCARLDLRQAKDRATFEELLARADIILHGYRPGALDHLGYGAEKRREFSPGLVDVCLCAYGWSGPWATRRGFDSLVQMSTGIAETGMRRRRDDKPVPLPVQALDHGTGYLMAAAAVRGITERLANGRSLVARLSLARTAKFLFDNLAEKEEALLAKETADDREAAIEETDWGRAQRISAPLSVEGAPMHWDNPARGLGSSPAHWL
jgi:CoA-transferase family III